MSPDPPQPSERGKCYFSKLSGEIRNRLYKYTFTSKHPLWFKHDRVDDTGKFYMRSPQYKGHQTLEDITAILSQALLECDQLRLVTKQLCAETKGLEIWCNDLCFQEAKDAA